MEAVQTSGERDEFVRRVTRGMGAGSEPAFREFYEAYFDRLCRHLLVQTRGDEQLARDLVQNVLLRVVRHGREFQSEAMFWAWLKQVARSCRVDWIRRNAKQPPPTEMLYEGASEADDDADLHEALERGLDALSIEERELIERSYVRAEPHKQIAEELQTTPKAVESKLARIRQKLRQKVLQALNDYALF
jgi:RNA polymerase sigma factor (sigma-70 family)